MVDLSDEQLAAANARGRAIRETQPHARTARYDSPRELRWLELVEEAGALLDRQLRARPGAAEMFRAALRHRVLHRDVVPF